jgi:hypothetical protein
VADDARDPLLPEPLAKPTPARMYDYLLGGKDHFVVDRKAAEQIIATLGEERTRSIAWENRRFLGRAVAYLSGECGITQFIDVGAGLPTMRNTHEIAQEMDPGARVVYVDNDPVVISHVRTLATTFPDGGDTSYLDADARDPDAILAQASKTLDLARPVAVMMVDLLNFIEDDATAASVVSALMAAVPSGSYLALMHPASDLDPALLEAERRWNQLAAQRVRLRSRAQVAGFLAGLSLVEPGLVTVPQWRPGPDDADPDASIPLYAAVAGKP